MPFNSVLRVSILSTWARPDKELCMLWVAGPKFFLWGPILSQNAQFWSWYGTNFFTLAPLTWFSRFINLSNNFFLSFASFSATRRASSNWNWSWFLKFARKIAWFSSCSSCTDRSEFSATIFLSTLPKSPIVSLT